MSARDDVVDDVKPGEESVQDGPEDRLMGCEGDGDGQGRAEVESFLDDLHFGFLAI